MAWFTRHGECQESACLSLRTGVQCRHYRDEFECGFIIPQASELLKKAKGFLPFLREKTQGR